MTAKIYRIKPLAWEEDTFPDGKHIDTKRRLFCKSVFGKMTLEQHRIEFKYVWTFHILGDPHQRLKGVETVDQAKTASEAVYIAKLTTALESVS